MIIGKELILIIEPLKEFCMILLRQHINADYNNLMCSNFDVDSVYHFHLLLEEIGPQIHYVLGSKNEATEALIGLPYNDTMSHEHYELNTDDLSGTAFCYVIN